jgi:hypothetical protein
MERWCIVFRPNSEPIRYYEGTLDEMLHMYERLATSWTGVVLCQILVPDASECEMGEARRRFNELKRLSTDPNILNGGIQ